MWENTRLSAIGLELVGFLILISGNLVYNGTIKLSFLGGYKKGNFDINYYFSWSRLGIISRKFFIRRIGQQMN